jgi:hypothetical protein
MPLKLRKKILKTKVTTARLDAFARGQIWGMHLANAPREQIVEVVQKKDGSAPTLSAVDRVICHKTQFPKWRGTDSCAGGRPSTLTASQQKKLVALVFKERGSAVVTIKYCRRKLPFLRKVSRWTCARALHAAGLAWLTRRRKNLVPKHHKPARITYCRWILACHVRTLKRFAYTDGTTFFLARGPAELKDKKRAALGKCVWKMSTGKDGLWEENIGPSLYAKAQGYPVKIWGFLANGRLEYWVLPRDYAAGKYKTTNMNGERYRSLVKSKFAGWRQSCFGDSRPCHLVQDHEKCLWQDGSLERIRFAGCPALPNYPKCSADLNPIENVWGMLKQRLDSAAPAACESRADFLARLRRAVSSLNDNESEKLLHLCTNQKERAHAVLPDGGRSKW